MATKTIELPDVGSVTLVKRTQSRNLRLSVTRQGVRVSMPRWTPFAAGEAFARKHETWIKTELAKVILPDISGGQRIGKMHYVRFEHVLNGPPTTSRVTATEIIVRLAPQESPTDAVVQTRAQSACVRALKREVERLLPPRVAGLAAKHGRTYASVSAKQLKRRWGSCDSTRNLTFNLFLMELPWDYIDYVIMHELAHTVHMDHGPNFWQLLCSMEPRARDISKQLKRHQPTVGTWQH